MSEWTIRPVVRSDAAAIAAILKPIVTGGWTAMTGPVTEQTQLAFFDSLPPQSLFLAAVDASGTLAGIQDVLEADDGVGEISTFVDLRATRRGVGRALMAATLERAPARGWRSLHAVIRSDNARAMAFYRSCGFQGPDGDRRTVLSRPVSCAP